jgi:G:T/U-mismatch repair DNA glycosylase
MKKTEEEIETHPDWYHDIPEMKVMILGNFPPHRKKWDYEFYYPNKINNFWKVLAALAGKPLKEMKGGPAVEERKRIMEKLKVGVFNIAKSIKRKGVSARDTDIEIVEYNDLVSVLKKHKELRKIVLAGYSAPNSTARKFIEYLDLQGISFERPTLIKMGSTFKIRFENREIECVILNSTSTAFPIKLDVLVEQFRPHVLSGIEN